MAFARLIIDGEDLDFMGDIEDKFLGYTNTASASRSGRNYIESQPTPRMVSVGDIMANPDDLERIEDFFTNCGERRFTATIALSDGCDSPIDGASRIHYINCVLEGDSPTANLITKKVSDFEFSYERRRRVD